MANDEGISEKQTGSTEVMLLNIVNSCACEKQRTVTCLFFSSYNYRITVVLLKIYACISNYYTIGSRCQLWKDHVFSVF